MIYCYIVVKQSFAKQSFVDICWWEADIENAEALAEFCKSHINYGTLLTLEYSQKNKRFLDRERMVDFYEVRDVIRNEFDSELGFGWDNLKFDENEITNIPDLESLIACRENCYGGSLYNIGGGHYCDYYFLENNLDYFVSKVKNLK